MKPEKIPAHLLRHPVENYLSCDPLCDDSDVSCRKVEIVRIRKPCECHFDLFDPKRIAVQHPAGTYMWVEHALVDGRFQSIYACLQHIAVFIDFSDDGEIDPCELSCTEAESHQAHNALNC